MESLVSIFIKKIKIKLEWCQKEHHLELLKRLQRQIRYVQKRIMFFEQKANVHYFEKHLFFSHQKCHAKLCTLARAFK